MSRIWVRFTLIFHGDDVNSKYEVTELYKVIYWTCEWNPWALKYLETWVDCIYFCQAEILDARKPIIFVCLLCVPYIVGKLIQGLHVARYTEMNKGCSEKGYSQFSWGRMRASSNIPSNQYKGTHTHTHTPHTHTTHTHIHTHICTHTHAYICLHASSRWRKESWDFRRIFFFPCQRTFAMLARGGLKANGDRIYRTQWKRSSWSGLESSCLRHLMLST